MRGASSSPHFFLRYTSSITYAQLPSLVRSLVGSRAALLVFARATIAVGGIFATVRSLSDTSPATTRSRQTRSVAPATRRAQQTITGAAQHRTPAWLHLLSAGQF